MCKEEEVRLRGDLVQVEAQVVQFRRQRREVVGVNDGRDTLERDFDVSDVERGLCTGAYMLARKRCASVGIGAGTRCAKHVRGEGDGQDRARGGGWTGTCVPPCSGSSLLRRSLRDSEVKEAKLNPSRLNRSRCTRMRLRSAIAKAENATFAERSVCSRSSKKAWYSPPIHVT